MQKVNSMQVRQAAGAALARRQGAYSSRNRTEMSRRAALVQQFPLFTGISSSDCGEIISAAHEKEFLRREAIHLQGDPVRQIALLTSGCVKVTQSGQNGTEVILRLNAPGEVVGTVALPGQGSHCSTARAVRCATAFIWDADVFEAISERFPIFRRNMARILSQRLEELEVRFREISTEQVAARLSHEIVRLLSQVGRRVNGYVEISLSQEELAQLTGTTLFTVSRLLSNWEERGIVSTRRETVMVSSLQALVELSESE